MEKISLIIRFTLIISCEGEKKTKNILYSEIISIKAKKKMHL